MVPIGNGMHAYKKSGRFKWIKKLVFVITTELKKS